VRHGFDQGPENCIDGHRRRKNGGNIRIENHGTTATLEATSEAIRPRLAVVKAVLTTALFWRPCGKKLDRLRVPVRDEDEWGVTPDKGHLLELSPVERQKLDSLAKALYARPALQLEISGSVDPDGDREGLQRAALDREIRSKIWTTLRKSERATNSVDQIVLAPDERAHWVKKLYGEAVADGNITPQLIAANTNLAAYAATVLPRRLAIEKGATKLMKSGRTAKAQPAASAGYQTKLVPPPDPMEAVLLATFPIGESDLETLAASRAKAVRAYLLQTGKVEAARLFLKEDQTAGLRSDGSRVYLQFR